MRSSRLVRGLAVVFGAVGVIASMAGAYGVWRVHSRLDRANDQIFDTADSSLAAIQGRVPRIQERVRESKVTADELSALAHKWAAEEARDRLAARIEVEAGPRVDRLVGQIQATDDRLEATAGALRELRRLLELGRALGVDVDPGRADPSLEQIGALRDKLHEAATAIAEIRNLTTPVGSVQHRLVQIAKLLARIVLTLLEADARLNEFAQRLTEVRGDTQKLRAKVSNSILLVSITCYGLLAWIAAGQITLCRWGLTQFRNG